MAIRWFRCRGPQRYSYVALLLAAAVGVLAPGRASWVLGPVLLLGLALLGVAHGACDQFVVPATRPELAQHRGRYWAVFLGGYLGLAAAVGLLWWWQPGLAVAFFFGLSAWHWGSGDAPRAVPRGLWVAHSVLRGALLFAVPLLHWPTETLALTNNLLTLAGATPLPLASVLRAAQWLGPLVLGGHLLLWLGYWARGQATLATTDMREVVVLGTLLLALPPLLSAGMYFVFWHSLQHVLRMNALMGLSPIGSRPTLGVQLGFFLRRSAPLLAISLGALAVVYGLAWTRAASGATFISLALLAASVVTLPHALLVTLGLDAARWRRAPLAPSAPTKAPIAGLISATTPAVPA
ncbi:hypothetical protein FNT36_14745 [Hymenobacter setariae]|uniref:Probable beta-carotene 15,15'-dioxygenase n=1 Tax=Hymenobacter setariae TaxID=2594794 RepID=A0A558BW06_9BACT|nr:Brp/Blh family beta-carotene 15,15'-dioxygenase [Hymenobacter setariae]TVT40715.1 hypothetical protein FNT36_14745 [Hymenobacter setariae]